MLIKVISKNNLTLKTITEISKLSQLIGNNIKKLFFDLIHKPNVFFIKLVPKNVLN